MKIKSIFFLTILLTGNFCFAQVPIDSLVNKYGQQFPQEKIYLHLDKTIYSSGETIWFKAYLTADNLMLPLSKTMYAELIDDKGKILQTKSMPILASGAASNFDLADTITNTKLFIRAYTSWMLNFDSSLLYLKALQIIPSKKTNSATATIEKYNLSFFPEGGDLLLDVTCRVAFKAANQFGIPFDVSGDIVDSKKSKVANFSSTHDGMGYFFITPTLSETYKAIWKDKKGILHETTLPTAKQQSVALSVSNTNNKISYTITRPQQADDAFTSFTVIAQMQHAMVYAAKINLSKKNMVTAPIPTEDLGGGIMQITIFNAKQIPVAERIVFLKKNDNQFITDLHAIEKNITKNGKNTLQIDVGDTLLTNLSISVTDEALNPVTKNEENIYSSLLVTSDIKGYVYNSAYYFSSDEDSVKQHLDLVMLTSGWRRLNWGNLLAQKWPEIIYPIDNYITVSGKIYGLSKNQLIGKDLTGFIKTKNSTSNFLILPVNSEGKFKLSDIYLFDTAKLYYQINGDKDKKLTNIATFKFDNLTPNAGTVSNNLMQMQFANIASDSSLIERSKKIAALIKSQNDFNKTKTLEVVKVTGRVKTAIEKLDEEYTSGFFSGGDGYTFDLINDPFANSAFTVLDYLRSKVAGLQINTSGEPSASWRGSQTSVFLNETNTDLNMIQGIPMSDVAMIKVMRPPFFGAIGGGSGGAIAVYTKKGASLNNNVQGLSFTNINGYSAIKEFYSPNYETNSSNEPDLRSTLYWNPFVILDKNTRRIKLPFYNSDNCKKIRVIVEGINEKGQLSREEKMFE